MNFLKSALGLILYLIALFFLIGAVAGMVGSDQTAAGICMGISFGCIGSYIGWVGVRLRRSARQSKRSRLAGKRPVDVIEWDWITDRSDESDWRGKPATERQMDFADDLGIVYSPNVTRGELSDMITAALEKRNEKRRR